MRVTPISARPGRDRAVGRHDGRNLPAVDGCVVMPNSESDVSNVGYTQSRRDSFRLEADHDHTY
jgi:hypothetical protein